MADFNTFIVMLLSAVSTFLNSEPIIYFVWLIVICFLMKWLSQLMHLTR